MAVFDGGVAAAAFGAAPPEPTSMARKTTKRDAGSAKSVVRRM